MLHSMTGYGKATGIFENKKITVEMRSLNSKSLDLYVRIPNLYKEKEIELRKLIGEGLERGKVECTVSIEVNDSKTGTLNKEAVKGYFQELKEIQSELGVEDGEMLSSVLRLPDVFTTPTEELNEDEWNLVAEIAHAAMVKLQAFRAEEGEALIEDFTQRIQSIDLLLREVPQYEKDRIVEIKNRIEQNLEDFLTSTTVDKNRLEQEMIYYVEKIDISEEKQRLKKHLDYFLETMDSPNSNGKKLGFISQEIGREINTLGSKSYHSEMQKCVVQMKDELEKIKEQVLNTL